MNTEANARVAAVAEATIAALTEAYNAVADKPVKKFASKGQALGRLEALLGERGLTAILADDGTVTTEPDPDYSDEGGNAIDPTEDTTDQTISPEEERGEPHYSENAQDSRSGIDPTEEPDQGQPEDGPAEEGHDWGSPVVASVEPSADSLRAMFPDTAVITVLNPNPGKRGKRGARFACYATGMTVGAYLDAARKVEGSTRPRHKYRKDLRWDVQHGFIAVGPTVAEQPEQPQEQEGGSE